MAAKYIEVSLHYLK